MWKEYAEISTFPICNNINIKLLYMRKPHIWVYYFIAIPLNASQLSHMYIFIVISVGVPATLCSFYLIICRVSQIYSLFVAFSMVCCCQFIKLCKFYMHFKVSASNVSNQTSPIGRRNGEKNVKKKLELKNYKFKQKSWKKSVHNPEGSTGWR